MNAPSRHQHADPGKPDRSGPGDEPTPGDIVLVGGYGQVGTRLAGLLAPRFPGRVVIAGRRRQRARLSADQLGHRTRAAVLDADELSTPTAAATLDRLLARADLVLVCAAHASPALAEAALHAGVAYVDVTADAALIAGIEALDPVARRTGATAVLSVGLAPGLSNLLAAAACAGLDTVDRVDLLVRLGLGDVHGPAAVTWTLDNLTDGFTVAGPAGPQRIRPFTQRRRFPHPDPHGPEHNHARSRQPMGYRFNFPEQHTLPRTLGVPAAASWLALAPPSMAAATALAVRAGAGRLLRPPLLRRIARTALTRVHLGSDQAGVTATATGTRSGAPANCTLTVTSRDEAALTALVAANIAEQLLEGDVPAGVHHIEQITDAAAVLPTLETLREQLSGVHQGGVRPAR